MPMAKLVACGLDYRSAKVDSRERLAVSSSDLCETTRALSARLGGAEAVLLSTCNRVEVYAFADAKETAKGLRSWFIERGGDDILPVLNYWTDEEAARHLYRVAAGLESMVIGEHQILGQVRTAYESARQAGTAGRGLNVLFQAAISSGKWVRARTPLSAGISSVGGAAATLAAKIFGNLSERRVLLFGAGKMAESSARHLLSNKAGSLVVANRSLERAQELAAALGGEGITFLEGLDRLGEFDIILCSTACPHVIMDVPRVSAALNARRGRSIFIIDIAVPRNVDSQVGRLDGVVLYNIDALEAIVQDSLVQRRGAVELAERAIDEKTVEFMARRSDLYGMPYPVLGTQGLRPCFNQG